MKAYRESADGICTVVSIRLVSVCLDWLCIECLVMICCEFELLVHNLGGVTLACIYPALVKGMCSPGLCACLD